MSQVVNLYNLISRAVEAGDVAEVENLFCQNPSELKDQSVPLGGNWLNRAAGFGTLEMVKYFLKKGFGTNTYAGSLNESPLLCAVSENRCDIAEYLIDNGAIFDMKTSSSNPLFKASSGDALEAIKLLLKKGCDPRVKYDFGASYGRPEGYLMDVFMRAREWGKMDIAKAIADWTHVHFGYPTYEQQEADFLAGYPA